MEDQDLITVQMLGGFNLRSQRGPVEALPRKSASLLAYLIMNRSRPQTRDLLAGRFWSDLPEDKARKRLSNTLWQIRTALGSVAAESLILATNSTIQVSPDWLLEADVDDFERQLDDIEREWANHSARGPLIERLSKLIADYPGDLLAGYYDDWIEGERSRIRDRYTAAVWQVIRLFKARSDYVTALRYARQLVAHDRLAEESHREVMRLCALLGQVGAAERQYQTCWRVLEDELGVEPSWDTTELIERIKAEASNAAAPMAAIEALETPIVGRSRERAVLLARVDDLMSGQGGLALVEGDPGMGKSRVVTDLMDAAEWRGARVLSAGHTELSRSRPYQGLHDSLAPVTSGLRGEHLAEVVEPIWLEHASVVFPDLARYLTGPVAYRALRREEEPARMNEALARVLLAQGGLGPTLVVLEDAHWCDDDSMMVLTNLGNRLSRSGVLICLTYRRFEAEQTDNVWSAISHLEGLPSTTRVVLGSLNKPEIRELVSAEVGPGALPNRVIEQLVEESDGNPLFVLEALRDPEALLATEGAVHLPGADIGRFPETVAKALQRRIGSLPDDVSKVLQSMAVVAEPCSSQLVSTVTGLDRRGTLTGMTEAVKRGFLVEMGAGICRFVHDQTRRSVYHSMSDPDILKWHERIFRALVAEEGVPAEQLAQHADMARLWDESIHWHSVAAHSAKSINAFGVAAEHYRQADEAAGRTGRSPVERFDELLRYEQALDVLGRRDEQQVLLKRLVDLELPLEARIHLAERQAWLLGQIDRHEEAAQLAIEWADRAWDASLPNYRLLTVLGVVRYWSGGLPEAVDALRRALKAAPDDDARVTIRNHLGRALIDLSEFDEGNALVAEALEMAEDLGDIRSQVEALTHRAISAVRRGRNAEALEFAEHTLPLSRSIGYRYGEGVALMTLANMRTGQGQAGMALPLFAEAADVFESLGNSRAKAHVNYNLGEFHLRFLGENDEAAQNYGAAATYFRSVGDRRLERMAMANLSAIDWRSGRRRLARRRLQGLIEWAETVGDPMVELEARRIGAECATSVDSHLEAIVHLDRVIDLIEDSAMASVLPHALAHRGLAALDAGHPEDAERFVDQAAPPNKPESEFALITAWRCGKVYRAVDRPEDAAAQFALAYRLLDSNLNGLESERAAKARNLPQFAAIIEDYEIDHERVIEVELPAVDAPTGRPLHSDDYLTVAWTLSRPTDWSKKNSADRRKIRIDRLCGEAVNQGGLARIVDLAAVLEVSERTIKRDLSDLRAKGQRPKTRRSA